MNSLPRLVGNGLNSTSDAGQNIMVVTNPESSDNDREIKYLDPENMKIGTSGNYIELNDSSSSVSIQSYNTTIGKTGSSSNTALTVSPDNDDITLNSDYGINILAGGGNASTKIKLRPTELELNASVFNINNCPYKIGDGRIAYNVQSIEDELFSIVPNILTHSSGLEFPTFYSNLQADNIAVNGYSPFDSQMYTASIDDTVFMETGGCYIKTNSSPASPLNLNFKSTCMARKYTTSAPRQSRFAIIKKLNSFVDNTYTTDIYLCMIYFGTSDEVLVYQPSNLEYYLPLKRGSRLWGILELVDGPGTFAVPGTADWTTYVTPYLTSNNMPNKWFNNFGCLDFYDGIVSIKDGKIIKKTW